MFISKTIKSDLVTVTPEMARKLLEQNTRNRNVSKANYSKVLEAMSAGEWELNGEAIKIARDGTLLDGQHRCLVSAENNIPFQTLVVYGLPVETQDTMDTGKSRGPSDVLAINWYKQTADLASITTGIIRAERWGLRAATYQGATAYSVTAKQVLARVEEEPSLVDLVGKSRALRKAGLTAKIAGILYYEFSKIDQLDADAFFEKLESGEGLQRNDPILTLRESLIRLKTSVKGTAGSGYIAALVIKAWNKYRAGESVSLLRYTPGGANPEKFPEPI
ncbi:hypothetical protein [Corynebacterium lubricantis]|uniref:hypothetical protein n=1 Tax=Corynebacterium lubricantis TaxID=541095 RepID=UPI00037DB8FD|nr:hypothetical protein [Corynebacterium lubricantis]